MAGDDGVREASSPRLALLRGINVGGHNRVSMAELRDVCHSLGWEGVRTYVQSGNVVFRGAGPDAELEDALQAALERRLQVSPPVIIRDLVRWAAYLATDPFPKIVSIEPNRVLLAVSKAVPSATASEVLQARANAGERIARAGDGFWIHFPEGSGRSRITPAILDRAFGSPVTTRNWRTVLALRDLADDA